MNKSRVSLVPIRFGAGIKGKIAESWFHGLPVCKNHYFVGMEVFFFFIFVTHL